MNIVGSGERRGGEEWSGVGMVEFEYRHECGDGVWRRVVNFALKKNVVPSFECSFCGERFTFSGVSTENSSKEEKKWMR